VVQGFEHSVANTHIIPASWLAGSKPVTVAGYASNLLIVTIVNVIGGGLLVALVYWLICRKDRGTK